MLRRMYRRRLPTADGGEFSFDFNGNDLMVGPRLLAARSSSPLVAAVSAKHTDVCAARYLSQVQVCSLILQLHDWVLLRDGSMAVIAQISQMALVSRATGGTDVYLWCRNCHVGNDVLEDADSMMRIRNRISDDCVLVSLQKSAISALVCESRDDHLEFRYVF